MKFKPHDYQLYCIKRMIAEPNLGLFLDMGLGKTVITLTALNDLKYNRFQIRKALVIAPKKVAEDTWIREQNKWDHLKLLRVVPVLGSKTKRIKALNTPGDIYVISRDSVQWLVDYYRNQWPFDTVVIDELSSFKSNRAKRFSKLKQIRSHIKRLYGLTGTPAPNGLMDLWAQVYLIDQGQRLGQSISRYREAYFHTGARYGENLYKYELNTGAEYQIKERIKDICISLTAKDYLKLPERINNTIYVRLDPKAAKKYKELEKKMLIEVDETTIDVTSAAALSNKLLQLCNGAIYDEDRNVIEIHDSKIVAFKELVEAAQGKPVLVFYNFKHDKTRILEAFKKSDLRIRELKDPTAIADWNAGNIDMLLAHPASAAYGLNLQDGGHLVIWFGLNWALELYQQANARLYRQGQKESVIVHHLIVDGGKDQEVLDVLQDKGKTQESLIEALKAKIREYKEDTKKG